MRPNINNTQKFFQGLAVGSFGMGAYNTMNNVKSKQLRDALERERIKNTELQNNLESLATKTNEQLDVIKEQNKNLLENIQEIANSKSDGSSTSSNYISNYFDSFQKFFDSLNFEQTLAITHISGSVFILISLISIAMILYGDFIIKYFNIEKKYPKIARFVQYRRKVKNIEIIITLILILIVLLTIIYINILIFKTY
jgi:hypothetical protein